MAPQLTLKTLFKSRVSPSITQTQLDHVPAVTLLAKIEDFSEKARFSIHEPGFFAHKSGYLACFMAHSGHSRA
jgi:hypothetical protein